MIPDYQDDPFVASNPENLPFWQAAEDGLLLFRVVRYLPVARRGLAHGTGLRAGVGQS